MLVPVLVLLPPAGGPGIVLRVGNVDRHSLIGRDRVWENLPSASVYALKIGRTLFLCGCHLARIPEENHKENAHHEGVGGEDVPGLAPARHGGVVHTGIHDRTGGEGTYGSTEAVGHQHKETLGGRAYVLGCVIVDIEGAGDVEEVEGYSVNDAAEYEKENSRHTRVTKSEEAEAEHPGEH